MSIDTTTYRNPLRRDGTSQRQRMLDALKPEYVRVDEKEIKDWLLYANEYASLVRYYNQQNQADGDWVNFFGKDISIVVAMVANETPSKNREAFEEVVEKAENAVGNPDASADAFAEMLVAIYELAATLADWKRKSVPGLKLQTRLNRMIAARLDVAYAQLLVWIEKAMELDLPLKENGLPEISIERLRRTWPYANVRVDEKPFPWDIPETERQINRELVKLEKLHGQFYEVYASIVKQAPDFLEETFTDYPEHQPHIALFLAFLSLMKVARDHMNSLTKRHLDFYYKDILQLKNRPEDRDEVHLIFELANNFESHRIAVDTEFDGGPDANGETRIYAADEEIIINRATLDEVHGLKNIFIHKDYTEESAEDGIAPDAIKGKYEIVNIYAAPDADSADGKGEDLPEGDPKWSLMGSEKMPYGEVGFALASPMLLLGEGERKVSLCFRMNGFAETIKAYGKSTIKSELRNNVNIFLTGEKEWIPVENRLVDILTDIRSVDNNGDEIIQDEIVFTLSLGPEIPAVVPYNEEIHQRGFKSRFPTAIFILDNEGLSTLGNLDLNLKAGISVFDPEAEYLAGEFVRIEEGNVIYRNNADIIGIDPVAENRSELVVWSPVNIDSPPAWKAVNPDPALKNKPYIPGDVVIHKSVKFRANATLFNQEPDKDNPDKIWKLEPLADSTFEEDKQYPEGTFVRYDESLYESKAVIEPIDPLQSSSWSEINQFISGKKYLRDDLANSPNGDTYILRATEATGINPESDANVLIWQEILPHEIDRVELYQVGEVTKIGNRDLYRAVAQSKGIVPSNNVGDNGWDSKPVHNNDQGANIQYAQNDEVTFDGRLYQALMGNKFVKPDVQATSLWDEFPQHDRGKIYVSTSVKEEIVFKGKFYVASERNLNVNPDGSLQAWTVVSLHNLNTDYQVGTVVRMGNNKFYQANAANLGVAPDGSSDGWEKHVSYKNNPTGGIYAIGDKVTHNSRLYAALAATGGIEPLPTGSSVDNGWELIPAFIPVKDTKYNNGDLVSLLNNVYKAKKDITVDASNHPTGSSDANWELQTITGTYDPNEHKMYLAGNIVEHGTEIYYIATATTRDIAPDNTDPVWDELSVGEYDKGVIYGPSDTKDCKLIENGVTTYFKAVKKTRGDHPVEGKNDSSFPWDDLGSSAPPYSSQQEYKHKETVRIGTTFYFHSELNETINNDPEGITNPWVEINNVSSWSATKTYNPADANPANRVKTGTGQNTRYFQVKEIHMGADPSGVSPTWDDITESILGYNKDRRYDAGEEMRIPFITEPVNNPKKFSFFTANATTIGADPTKITNVWSAISTLPGDWGQSTPYTKDQLVGLEGSDSDFYVAQAPSINISPTLGIKIWEPLNNPEEFNILPYDSAKAYTQGELATYNNVVYYVSEPGGILTTQLAPAFNPNWENKSTLSEYDSRTEYSLEAFVRFRGQIYQSQAITRGVAPDSNLNMWEEIDAAPAEYTADGFYALGSYVQYNGKTFRANGGIRGITPPSIEFDDDPWTKILPYSSGKTYAKNSFVWIGGAIYRSKKTTSGIKPGEGEAWEEIQEIDPFDPGNSYSEFDTVFYQDFYYVANANIAASQDQAPGQFVLLWEEITLISEFDGVVQYLPGEYVSYGDRIYRAQTTIVGDDPENFPALWTEVGSIPLYKDTKKYFQFSLVKHLDKVYQAIRNVMGIAPGSAEDAGLFWREVAYSYPYKYLTDPQLDKLEVSVEVTGLKSLILENSDGTIDPAKPFNPFGGAPKVGGSFYIGSHEIFSKAPSKVLIKLIWGDLPTVDGTLDFNKHYEKYDDNVYTSATNTPPIAGNLDFKAKVQLLQGSNWKGDQVANSPILEGGQQELFKDGDAAKNLANNELPKDFPVSFNTLYLKRDASLESFDRLRNGMARGFMRFTLLRDFLHADFPRFVAKSAIEQKSEHFPNEPYTPLVNEISVDYQSSEIINYNVLSGADFPDRIEQFFHVHPFGQGEFYPVDELPSDDVFTSTRMVPIYDAPVFNPDGTQPENTDLQRLDANGNVLIGIKDLDPPQNLHVLFQVAEGSEVAEHDRQRVVWSYLRHNRWIEFKDSEILGDSSNQLLTSGIVKFKVPKQITSSNTVLPGGLFWIKGSIVNHADGIAKAIAVIPQAVQASYRKTDLNDPNHLATPLSAESVGSLLVRQAGVSGVSQPFVSFGGRMAETDDEFYVRVSERLRHKNRGITIWDYERLVLENFPKVYMIKCINHGSEDSELAPGNVLLVGVPDLRNDNAVDKLKPTLSTNLKLNIEEFLTAKASSFTTIRVDSPTYEEVKVSAEVKFAAGRDVGFYTQQLKKDIVGFMAPWLYNEGEELSFNRKLSMAAMLNYIDKRPYIDFVQKLKFFHRITEDGDWKERKDDEVVATTAASVLIPAGEDIHEIKSIEDSKCKTN